MNGGTTNAVEFKKIKKKVFILNAIVVANTSSKPNIRAVNPLPLCLLHDIFLRFQTKPNQTKPSIL